MADKSSRMTAAERDRIAAEERAGERRSKFWLQVIPQLVELFRLFVICLTVFGVGYWGYKSVEVASGKETAFSAILNSAVDWNVRNIATVLIVALLGGGWYRERTMRKREVARLSQRNTDLEKPIDPGRTTSGLTPTGGLPKGDET